MSNGSTAEYVALYSGARSGIERSGGKMVLRLKMIPWLRVIVDALLVAGILLASSSLLTVR